MGVLTYGILLARSVSAQRHTQDLMAVEGDPPTFGLYNPNLGEWLETFSRQECVERLEAWETHHRRPGQRVPYSAVTELGRKWLERQG